MTDSNGQNPGTWPPASPQASPPRHGAPSPHWTDAPSPATRRPAPATPARSTASHSANAPTGAATSRRTSAAMTPAGVPEEAATPSPCTRSPAPTFASPCPPGMEGSHLASGPASNWVPEGVAWEDKPASARRKPEPPAAPGPARPCRTALACPNLVNRRDRRCRACVAENGRRAAAMPNDGQPLDRAAAALGFSSRRVYQIAVEYGGYGGTPEQARGQRPPLTGWRARAAWRIRL